MGLMNKVIKLGLLSVALLSTIVTSAADKLTIKVGSKMLSISLTEVTNNETVHIKDFQGQILFSETLNEADAYTKMFSFSTLPEGIYFIESRSEEKIQVTPVLVKTNSVDLVDRAAKTFTAPKITLEEGIINVYVRNENKVAVSILVYDEQGTLLSETENNTNTLVLAHYNINNLNTKKVTISVSEGDYNFVEEIKL